MHKCLLKNRYYDNPGDKILPLHVNNENVLAIKLVDLLDDAEVEKLQEYVNLLFANTDDKRRKKYAVVNNKHIGKIIHNRLPNRMIASYMLGNVNYDLDEYVETVEVIKWLNGKFVKNKTFNDITGDNYLATPEFMYITFIIGLEPPSVSTKSELYRLDNPDGEPTKIKISSKTSLMYCSSYLATRESISVSDHTKIYFHVRYRARVV